MLVLTQDGVEKGLRVQEQRENKHSTANAEIGISQRTDGRVSEPQWQAGKQVGGRCCVLCLDGNPPVPCLD